MKKNLLKWMYVGEGIYQAGLLNILYWSYHFREMGFFWGTFIILVLSEIGFAYKTTKLEK